MKKRFTSFMLLAALLCWPAMPLFAQSALRAYFADADGNRVSKLETKLGEDFIQPRLVFEPAEAADYVRVEYQSTNPDVAEIDMVTGIVSIVGAGTTAIHATTGQTEQYLSARAQYTLTVIENTPVEPTCPEARWNLPADNVLSLKVGDAVSIPELMGATGSIIKLDADTIENPEVAVVTEDGLIYAVGAGTATFVGLHIHAEEGTTLYCRYSFGIVVTGAAPQKTGLKVKGIEVTSANADDVLGDGSHNVTFEEESRTLHLNSWTIDAVGMDLNAMIEDETTEVPLTIRLHGENAILNANTCIKADNVPVVVIGESVRDEWMLNAATVGIVAPYFKMHQCAIVVEASLAAMKLGVELGVSVNSHLLASSENLAIQVPQLILADGEEGVAILTPGVRFEPKKGFLTEDNKPAKEVEIGKVPVVVPDDEETTIDFVSVDPDNNESVVVSLDAENHVNEETGQLEISTALSDELVASALEELVPGSSAWLAFLPGSITFDIPAGEGEIAVECLTLPGYKLRVKVDGQAVVSIEQGAFGWATVKYNVAVPTHVVIYLHAESQASAPARLATTKEDSADAGAYIQTLKITPKKAHQGIDEIVVKDGQTGKCIIDGQLYIIRDLHIYNAQGKIVK
jgi:hypothetical protein